MHRYRYNDTARSIYEYREAQRKQVLEYKSYEEYLREGHDIVLLPAPVSIYFNGFSGAAPPAAHIGGSPGVEIKRGGVTGSRFSRNTPGADEGVSGIILFFGSLVAMVYGLFTFRDREFYAMLAVPGSRLKIFVSVFGARALIVASFMAIIAVMSLLTAALSGMPLTGLLIGQSLVFFGAGTLLLVFFMSIGMLFSSIREKSGQFVMVGLVWLLLMFSAGDLVDYLDAGAKENGKEAAAASLVASTFEAALIPTTFYSALRDRLSGIGVNDVMKLSGYALEMEREFTRFCREKGGSGEKTPVSFLTPDREVYRGGQGFAGFFLFGALVMSGMIAWLARGSYLRYCLNMMPIAPPGVKENRCWKLVIDKDYTILKGSETMASLIYLWFTGNMRGLTRAIGRADVFANVGLKTENGEEIPTPVDGLFYVCRFEKIPKGVTINDFTRLIANLGTGIGDIPPGTLEPGVTGDTEMTELSPEDYALFMISLMEHIGIKLALIDNLLTPLNPKEAYDMTDRFETMVENGCRVVMISDIPEPAEKEWGQKPVTSLAKSWHYAKKKYRSMNPG